MVLLAVCAKNSSHVLSDVPRTELHRFFLYNNENMKKKVYLDD